MPLAEMQSAEKMRVHRKCKRQKAARNSQVRVIGDLYWEDEVQ
jgi:hypothetical protein